MLYNVADLAPFAAALTSKTRDLVVVELTGTHPLMRLAPIWEAVHGQPLPAGPTADLAVAVLREAGLDPEVHERVYQPLVRTGALLETWIDLTRQPALPAAGAQGRGRGADAALPGEAEALGGAELARQRRVSARVEIRVAGAADVAHLAELVQQFGAEEQGADAPSFAPDLLRWMDAHRDSHVPFLALLPSGAAVGMAWLALTARVPRPGRPHRLCGDVQSVYVVPEQRDAGVGAALLRTVLQHAADLGMEHVTVHSSERAVSVYERAGFGSSAEFLMWTPG